MRQVGNFNEGYLIALNSARCLPVSETVSFMLVIFSKRKPD